jgi:hypothetical protein
MEHQMDIPSQEGIAELSYSIWEKESHPSNRSVEHWLIAEQELKLRRVVTAESHSINFNKKTSTKAPRKQKAKVSFLKQKSRSRVGDVQ